MRPIVEVMAALRAAEVRVWPDGGQLRYQAPKGALTPALLAELRSRKEDILDLCRQARSSPDTMPLERAPRDADIELSLAQHRLWLLDRVEGPSPTYNIALALHLRGTLDAGALRKGCEALVRRHEALRTGFQLRGDTARPVIATMCPLPWSMVDLQHQPEELRLPEARRQARDEALRPFDLARAPLIRFVLWTLGARQQVLMMTLHHIIADGRSIEILTEELGIAYRSHRLGREPRLPEFALQYSDFAWQQRRALSDRLLQGQLDHWRERLAGLPPLLEVPTDRVRPPVFSSAGATIASRLSRDAADRLKRLAQQSGATLYMALVAAFATLLARYTGRDDIPIACPATHRNRPELDRLVGFFINTLPLRVDLSGDPTFRELLARVRKVVGDAFRNQDLPFDKVVEALRVERDPSHPPLVQVSMVLRDATSACPPLQELETEPFEFDNPIARFDIALEMYETDAAIDVFWIYSSSLYDPATIERMARNLINLIGQALADPDQCVFRFDLLDATERDRLLVEYNDTERPYPRDTTVDALFEQLEAKAPDAVAVQFGDQELSYRALNQLANRLAWRLRALGAGPGTLVAVFMERALELPAALLAVLKAGAAFVAIDPDDPLERIDQLLSDVQPVIIVSIARLTRRLPGRLPAKLTHVLCLDVEHDAIAGESAHDPPHETTGESLAYVIQSSGSTGRPKGVAVIHRGIVRLVTATDPVALSPRETLLQLASVNSAVSTFEIWGALLNGGRLAILPPGAPTLVELGAALRRHGVTTLWLPAGLFHLMVDERPDDLRGLRQLLTGGDVLSPDHVRRCLADNDGRLTLINGYGPTEATAFACCHAVTSAYSVGRTVPIGRPTANTRAYVLDTHARPAPIGVEGDLFIGGDGLARGYLNEAAATAGRFVADPFDPRPGRRMYRTGDRACWLADGTLKFQGRRDRQVKLRGFRIEPGEIETAVRALLSVHQAVVHAAADDGDQRLIVYVTSASGAPSLPELRSFLRRRLPDYMLPGAVVPLDALPLTRHGIVDHAALQRLHARAATAPQYEPPANDAEARLAAIWASVLGCERIGRHDVFFDLGGHSLLATRIVARVEDAFGVALPIRVLFEDGTVASMARALTDGAAAAEAALRARIERMEPDEIRALLQSKRGGVSGAPTRDAGGNRFDEADAGVS